MKKYLAHSLLVSVLFGNSGAGCGSKNSDDPQPGNDIKLLVKGNPIGNTDSTQMEWTMERNP